jgi:hypothetical protein
MLHQKQQRLQQKKPAFLRNQAPKIVPGVDMVQCNMSEVITAITYLAMLVVSISVFAASLHSNSLEEAANALIFVMHYATVPRAQPAGSGLIVICAPTNIARQMEGLRISGCP